VRRAESVSPERTCSATASAASAVTATGGWGRSGCRSTTHKGAESRQHLLERTGTRDAIVGAGVQAGDPRLHPVLLDEQEHRWAELGAAQLGENAKAVGRGVDTAEHDDLDAADLDVRAGFRRARSHGHLVPGTLKRPSQRTAIPDEQHVHADTSPPPCFRTPR